MEGAINRDLRVLQRDLDALSADVAKLRNSPDDRSIEAAGNRVNRIRANIEKVASTLGSEKSPHRGSGRQSDRAGRGFVGQTPHHHDRPWIRTGVRCRFSQVETIESPAQGIRVSRASGAFRPPDCSTDMVPSNAFQVTFCANVTSSPCCSRISAPFGPTSRCSRTSKNCAGADRLKPSALVPPCLRIHACLHALSKSLRADLLNDSGCDKRHARIDVKR